MSVKNILIVGVGGQGTLLASKLLGAAFVEQGYDVKVSEVHGIPLSSRRGRRTSFSPSNSWRPPGGCPISSQEGC